MASRNGDEMTSTATESTVTPAEVRKLRGELSQTAFAEICGISRSTVQAYEAGSRKIALVTYAGCQRMLSDYRALIESLK